MQIQTRVEPPVRHLIVEQSIRKRSQEHLLLCALNHGLKPLWCNGIVFCIVAKSRFKLLNLLDNIRKRGVLKEVCYAEMPSYEPLVELKGALCFIKDCSNSVLLKDLSLALKTNPTGIVREEK